MNTEQRPGDIVAQREAVKDEQERSRKRRAEQADEMRHRANLEKNLAESAKAMLGTSEDAEAERRSQALRLIRDGVAEDAENLLLEIRRDVEMSQRQRRLSQPAATCADNLLRMGTAFAGRKRKLEEVESRLGRLRRAAKDGAPLPSSGDVFTQLGEGCRELQGQIAELTQALCQLYGDYSELIGADRRRELLLRDTYEECLEHLESRERGKTEIQVRDQTKELDYDKRIVVLEAVVKRLVTAIPPMRERLVDRSLVEAQTSLAEGNADRAFEFIADAQKYAADSLCVLRVEAASHEAKGDIAKALQIWTRITKHTEAAPDDALALMLVCEKAGRPEQAMKVAAESARKWEQDVRFKQRWGDLAWNLCRWDDAVEAYAAVCESDADSIKYFRRYGCALVEAERYTEALEILREAVHRRDTNGPVHRYLGRAYAGLGQTEVAVEEFQRALEVSPDDPKNHLALARAMIQRGEYDDAIATARKALELAEDKIPALETLGQAQLEVGDFEAVLETLGDMVTSPRVSIDSVLVYATAAWRCQRFEEAEAILAPAVRRDPQNTELRHIYGLICIETGRMEQAVKLMG